jgi:hypothetical protein
MKSFNDLGPGITPKKFIPSAIDELQLINTVILVFYSLVATVLPAI